MDAKSILQSKFVSVLLVGVLVLVMIVTAKLLIQKRSVNSDIKKLQTDTAQVEKNSQELSELIKYLETPEYAELQAREKLNLKKEGEQVVVLPKDNSAPAVTTDTKDNTSNPIKWFNYFFSKRS